MPHRSTTYVAVAYCYPSSSVVCVWVCDTVRWCAKRVEHIELSFWVVARVGGSNGVLDEDLEVLRDVATATNFGLKLVVTGF